MVTKFGFEYTPEPWQAWIPNEAIESYVFHDSRVNEIKDFDYYARGELIKRKINIEDYLAIEKIRGTMLHMNLSKFGKNILKEILEDF